VAKTTSNKSEKKALKKTPVTPLLKEVKNKLKSTRKELQKQVDELTSQVKTLRKKSSKSAKKLIKQLDKKYQKKTNKLQNEVDERLESLRNLQQKMVAQLPDELMEKLHLKEHGTAKAITPVKKARPRKPRVSNKVPTIASINGIGPVMQKQLASAGFATLEDLANTPESKTSALKQFEKTRGFDTWQKQAKELLEGQKVTN